MSSITAQQAKLNLELVPKEKRLEIGKCNKKLNPRKIQRETTFQVVLDALALIPCYSAFLITAGVPEVYMHQFWDSVYKHDIFYRFNLDKRKRFKLNLEVFRDIFKISPRVQGQDIDVLPTDEGIMSLSGKTSDLSLQKEETQIYGAILPYSLTSPEMNETKAYKTYLGFASGATPPKKAQKFKKPASPKLTNVLVSTKEPMGKSKRVKRPAKKTTKAPARGVVIRETPEILVSKKKDKVDVTRGKGIELPSQVALTEDAQFEEVRKKSMRDFHKTHPSRSGTVTKTDPSAAKIKTFVTSEGTGVKLGVPDVTEEDSSKSKDESWGNDEDDSNNEQESSSEDSDQKNDSDDDKTQSDNENESNSEHETDENESGSESDQDENEEDQDDEKK
ncbi:hypothetical protein Tco_1211522 [Tanacetum coccineum]